MLPGRVWALPSGGWAPFGHWAHCGRGRRFRQSAPLLIKMGAIQFGQKEIVISSNGMSSKLETPSLYNWTWLLESFPLKLSRLFEFFRQATLLWVRSIKLLFKFCMELNLELNKDLLENLEVGFAIKCFSYKLFGMIPIDLDLWRVLSWAFK